VASWLIGFDEKKYGADAGYSEEHGTVQPVTQPHLYTNPAGEVDQGYGTLTSNQEGGQPGGAIAANPFTQQQYDSQKSSNPFKK